MLPSLPPEILDHIIDHLHDEPTTLKACCVASKSWVSRTRTHLFARINFHPVKSPIESWMKAFPDPSNSPAHYTRSLSIFDPSVLTPASAYAHPWIRAFNLVAHIALEASWWDGDRGSLAPLHGLSSSIRSFCIICLHIPPSEVLNLACSLPSLEDLTLISHTGGGPDEWAIPLTSPKLTGTLHLSMQPSTLGIRPFIRHLLDLPGGLHFSKISVNCPDDDAELTLDLVSRCFATLESLRIGCPFSSSSTIPPPLDLSNATKLEDMKFWWVGPNIRWIITTLKTAKARSLRQVTIHAIVDSIDPIETVRREWQDLDRLLVELWISCSVRPKITPVVYAGGRGNNRGELVASLLPELASRGAIDTVEDRSTVLVGPAPTITVG